MLLNLIPLKMDKIIALNRQNDVLIDKIDVLNDLIDIFNDLTVKNSQFKQFFVKRLCNHINGGFTINRLNSFMV